MMDQKSLYLGSVRLNGQPDWDPRVTDRISKLTPDEIGYQHVTSLTMNGVNQKFKIHEPIIEVFLTKPIPPKTTVMINRFAGRAGMAQTECDTVCRNGIRKFPSMIEMDGM